MEIKKQKKPAPAPNPVKKVEKKQKSIPTKEDVAKTAEKIVKMDL